MLLRRLPRSRDTRVTAGVAAGGTAEGTVVLVAMGAPYRVLSLGVRTDRATSLISSTMMITIV